MLVDGLFLESSFCGNCYWFLKLAPRKHSLITYLMIQSLAFEVSDKVSTEKKFKNFINFPELEDFNEFQLTMLIRFVTAFSNCSAHMVREVS